MVLDELKEMNFFSCFAFNFVEDIDNELMLNNVLFHSYFKTEKVLNNKIKFFNRKTTTDSTFLRSYQDV
jgi:hypothetical protein